MPGSREDGKGRFSRCLPPYRFTGKKMYAKNTMPGRREDGKGRFPNLTVLPFYRQ